MFVSDRFIYVQMQKTGCTHIASLLERICPGETVGKHNRATAEQQASGRCFISSTRNPWDWYLSLWTYGAQGRGGIASKLTRRHWRGPLRQALRNPAHGIPALINEYRKDIAGWQRSYQRSDDVDSFRHWLRMVHDPKNFHDLVPGASISGLAPKVGLMTYRYIGLCWKAPELLNTTTELSSLKELDASNCYIDSFIRQESLEDDLWRTLDSLNLVSEADHPTVYGAQKENTSHRPRSIQDYYDAQSIELVRRRDALLIEKFGYRPAF